MQSNKMTAQEYLISGAAYANYKVGKLNEAIDAFNNAIRLDPENAVAYTNRGLVYYKQCNLTLAIKDYTKAIEIDPKDVMRYVYRGLAYYIKSKLVEALDDFSKAIELNPEYAFGYVNCGLVYYKQGEVDKAIDHYMKAIELDPQVAVTYFCRGQAYDKQGKLAEAIDDLSKAIKLNPEFAQAKITLMAIIEQKPMEDIFNAIKKLPIEKAIHLLSQALNEKTLLGGTFRSSNINQSSLFADKLREDMMKHRNALIAKIVAVKNAVSTIAQGIREHAPNDFKFFGGLPVELGAKIVASVTEQLSPQLAARIIEKNYFEEAQAKIPGKT